METPEVTWCDVGGAYGVFEGVLGGDAVDFFDGVGRDVEAWRLTVVDHQHLVVLLVG